MNVADMNEIYKMKQFSTEFMLWFDREWNEVVERLRRKNDESI